jgi:hypothetical protein
VHQSSALTHSELGHRFGRDRAEKISGWRHREINRDIVQLSSIAIAGSTLLNNQALGGAGGEGFAAGGSLESSEAILFTVSNSTFVGNQAVGGTERPLATSFVTDGAPG